MDDCKPAARRELYICQPGENAGSPLLAIFMPHLFFLHFFIIFLLFFGVEGGGAVGWEVFPTERVGSDRLDQPPSPTF